MRGSVWAIVAGLVLAIFGAAVVAKIYGLPLAAMIEGEKPIWHILRIALPVAAFAIPGALAAILLSEGFRVRGFFYWLAVGVILAVLAHITLTSADHAQHAAFQSTRSFNTLLGMGVVGGILYWMLAGYRAGRLAGSLAVLGAATDLDERGLRKRCRSCAVATLALGLLPLSLVGWHAIYKPSPPLPEALAAKAAADGTKSLAEAGLPFASLIVDKHVGRITGVAPDEATRTRGFEKAKSVLEPMVGLPGVVAYLQNDLTVANPKPAEPPVPVASANSAKKLKPEEELRLAMEAKKANEAAAKAKEEEARKKAVEEAAAKAKADEEKRLAAEAKRKAEEEAAAKAKADEEKRLAEEAKKKADEEAAAKAREEERLALEAKKAAEEAAKAKEEERLALEVKRKADEEAAKAKAALEAVVAKEAAEREAAAREKQRIEDEKKLAADIEAQRKAAATAVVAEAKPGPAAETDKSSAALDPQCETDFGDAGRTTQMRFDINSNRFNPAIDAVIKRYADIAKRCGGYRLKIAGHADRTGKADVNQHVSLARAIAVRDALIAAGIPATRVDAEGFGASRLIDPAKTRAANRVNRRVEISAVPAAGPTIQTSAPVTVLPVEQCNAEFSRAFQNETIRFTGSSAIVDDNYAGYLDELARLALRCPTHVLTIGGHTDRRGRAEFNQALSQERADAVREALIDRDVPENRLSATGYGGERPFAPANTKAAYALNRRVDFGAAVRQSKSQ